MTVTINLHNCGDCRHIDYSGNLEYGNMKIICSHSKAKSYINNDENNVLSKNLKIPNWCPLRVGALY